MSEILIPIRDNKSVYANIYHLDYNKPIVILCHGFTGDQHEHGRFDLTSTELNKNGYNALTFDFLGSGKNKREVITLTGQAENLEDVSKWVISEGYKEIITIGLSFGGMTSLVAKIPERKIAVFWAPAFYFNRQFSFIQRLKFKFASIVGKTPIEIGPEGNTVLIDYNFMSDKNNDNTNVLLEKLNIPTLIVHGDADKTISVETSEEAFRHANNEKKLVVVKGADHGFKDTYLREFINTTIEFIGTFSR